MAQAHLSDCSDENQQSLVTLVDVKCVLAHAQHN